MLEQCAPLLGLVQCIDKENESKKKKDLGVAPVSLDLSSQSKDVFVRIIHAGGLEELYQNPVRASQLMKKYPGKCVARPEVFKNPTDSLLQPEEELLPGQKYFIIPSTTAQKLTRKHQKRAKGKEQGGKEEILDWKKPWDEGDGSPAESFCSAKDFYVSKERWSGCLLRKNGKGKKPFVPPLPKARMYRGLGWEPSLTSVEEISP